LSLTRKVSVFIIFIHATGKTSEVERKRKINDELEVKHMLHMDKLGQLDKENICAINIK
jgi:hypothetical protein